MTHFSSCWADDISRRYSCSPTTFSCSFSTWVFCWSFHGWAWEFCCSISSTNASCKPKYYNISGQHTFFSFSFFRGPFTSCFCSHYLLSLPLSPLPNTIAITAINNKTRDVYLLWWAQNEQGMQPQDDVVLRILTFAQSVPTSEPKQTAWPSQEP